MSSITSDEVNYLIYRYLQEAGFLHSAYCFGQESFAARMADKMKPAGVPPGALVALLQKGLHYTAIEAHLNDDGTEKECSLPFSLLEPHVCDTRSTITAAANPDTMMDEVSMDAGGNALNPSAALGMPPMVPPVRGIPVREPALPATLAPPIKTVSGTGDVNIVDPDSPDDMGAIGGSRKNSSKTGPPKPRKKAKLPKDMMMDIDTVDEPTPLPSHVWSDRDVLFIRDGLKPSITNCVLPLTGNQIIATGCASGWLQLWNRGGDNDGSFGLLREFDMSAGEDITCLNWHPLGTFLAVASLKGAVNVVDYASSEATPKSTLAPHHQGAVFSVKWSPSGRFLLSAGIDQSAAVWSVDDNDDDEPMLPPRRVYRHHKGPIMDTDWRTDESFATCSVDRTIAVYNNWMDQSEPVQVFTGHMDEVNAIAWDPTRTVLASCSDDATARLWRTSQQSAVHILSDHRKEIYSIRWSPTESRSGSYWLATASLDTTVRLWDAESGKCVRTLAKHSDAAFAVAFSPGGDLLATAAQDSVVHIWSLREGVIIRSFHAGPGGVFDLAWTRDGRALIAASPDDICVFDMAAAAGPAGN